ncbi:Beta-fructofuranosidase, soluble isoenzyme I [Senna tora]|uniref:beta-fructofuranosidase n=1 Tax=Senna tora TaxID=362788 RepID=A0A834X1S8_9FABA|nr:Beta-fructofuranosidase, soluble isoenzyme I [Senna tora]
MEANPSNTPTPHVLHTPLLARPARPVAQSRRLSRHFLLISGSVFFLLSLAALIGFISQNHDKPLLEEVQPPQVLVPADDDETTPFCNTSMAPTLRGVAQGVSSKSNPYSLCNKLSYYNWTNAMFSWQRTAFHFQPQENWMNGPLFYMGWYHLFYQYNPDSAVWGNITWGHAVSTDLIHWLYLPTAITPDSWYDINGVWTGSATLLPDGKIVMLYTGSTNESVQVQNLAYPANLSDPLLIDWVKYAGNPVLIPPPGIAHKDFRDPTTAWIGSDGKWRVTLGSKVGKTGVSLVYKTMDFIHFELNDHFLHAVPGTGMWECVDFFPVLVNGSMGLDSSMGGPGVKHVLKASLDDTKLDYYAIGTYLSENDTWVPDNPNEDVGIGLKLDYGRYYASKTFYDQNKGRRILWGWINETDTEYADLKKGWASLQTIPRTVVFDKKTGRNVVQWPVKEVESLRLSSSEFQQILLPPGSVLPLNIGPANQLDIIAEFEMETVEKERMINTDEEKESSVGCGSGSVERSAFGPFGILAIADDTLSELTPIYFRPSSPTHHANSTTFFCADETRSSKASDVLKFVYGSQIPVLSDEKLSMRVLARLFKAFHVEIDHFHYAGYFQLGPKKDLDPFQSRALPDQLPWLPSIMVTFSHETVISRFDGEMAITGMNPSNSIMSGLAVRRMNRLNRGKDFTRNNIIH